MHCLTYSLKGLLATVLTMAVCSAATAATPASSATAERAIGESTSALLQGDSARALTALRQVPAEQFKGRDADYRACMFGRFERAQPPWMVGDIADPFVREVLYHYQRYWWYALAAPAQREAQAQQLLLQLRRLLGTAADDAHDFDAVEPLLQEQLEQRGYYAILGRTPPLRELMLWRRQESRQYQVELPEGSHQVRVELLDDFVSRGWSSYARCQRGSAGGWATKEALFAVVPSYRDGLDGEAFRVVFLGHEAQHFADQNRFPDMLPWELEYRAKLVELAQAVEVSRKRLLGFMEAQSDDMDSPHTYANKRVIADLSQRLGKSPESASIPELQQAAREQLKADTARRVAGDD
jgi:hypothetical protein